jgi:hypothetical protein
METTDLTVNQIAVVVLHDDRLGVMVSPGLLIDSHGPDPAAWADVLASVLESICKAHQGCVQDENGERPSIDAIRSRILEVLPGAVRHKMDQKPLLDQLIEGESE